MRVPAGAGPVVGVEWGACPEPPRWLVMNAGRRRLERRHRDHGRALPYAYPGLVSGSDGPGSEAASVGD